MSGLGKTSWGGGEGYVIVLAVSLSLERERVSGSDSREETPPDIADIRIHNFDRDFGTKTVRPEIIIFILRTVSGRPRVVTQTV